MLATWNVRGMNAVEKQREVVHFVNRNKLGLVGLIETKLKRQKLLSCHNKFFQSWKYVDNCDQHPRGRIWILWREAEFEVRELVRTANYFHL